METSHGVDLTHNPPPLCYPLPLRRVEAAALSWTFNPLCAATGRRRLTVMIINYSGG